MKSRPGQSPARRPHATCQAPVCGPRATIEVDLIALVDNKNDRIFYTDITFTVPRKLNKSLLI